MAAVNFVCAFFIFYFVLFSSVAAEESPKGTRSLSTPKNCVHNNNDKLAPCTCVCLLDDDVTRYSGIPDIYVIVTAPYGVIIITSIIITSECKTLWGEPERVHRISAVNIKDECTV